MKNSDLIISVEPVAFVRNSRKKISDDYWGNIISEIVLTTTFKPDSIKGIEEFSHLEILFYFDKADNDKIKRGASHPRNNPDWPETGIFAQRGKNRPNRLGATIVKFLKVEQNTISVEGLDAIDGTPVLDIKPVIKEFLPTGEIKQPSWAGELMSNYWKSKN